MFVFSARKKRIIKPFLALFFIMTPNTPTPAHGLKKLTTKSQLNHIEASFLEQSQSCKSTASSILVCIFCATPNTQKRAINLLKRDMGSHLQHIMQERNAVCAQLRLLDTFSPSECLSLYHYHLQRSLGTKAQVWLSTKGGAV